MISGAHSILYSTDPEADRSFLRDVLSLPHVDDGGGWLIFGLPPSEVAVHPSGDNELREFYLLCDDIEQFVTEVKKHDATCSELKDEGWGIITTVTLPGGGKLGVYQARHKRPPSG